MCYLRSEAERQFLKSCEWSLSCASLTGLIIVSLTTPRFRLCGRGLISYQFFHNYSMKPSSSWNKQSSAFHRIYSFDSKLFFTCSDYFGLYADACFANFGDRVKHWITLNEPLQTSVNGHCIGIFAPGRNEKPLIEPYLVSHHQVLAHATAVSIYRSKYKVWYLFIVVKQPNFVYFTWTFGYGKMSQGFCWWHLVPLSMHLNCLLFTSSLLGLHILI